MAISVRNPRRLRPVVLLALARLIPSTHECLRIVCNRLAANPLNENRLDNFAPCGAVAGIMARIDAQRGVWKAPAGMEAAFSGVQEFTRTLTDGESGRLNPLGLNCLRSFPVAGNLVWGARTLAGADLLASEWKYLPVRRFACFWRKVSIAARNGRRSNLMTSLYGRK